MVLLFSIQLAKINGNTRESTRKDPLEPSYLDFADLVLNIQGRFLLSLMRVLLYSACNNMLECVQQYARVRAIDCVQQYVRVHELIYCVFKFLHAYLSFVQF